MDDGTSFFTITINRFGYHKSYKIVAGKFSHFVIAQCWHATGDNYYGIL